MSVSTEGARVRRYSARLSPEGAEIPLNSCNWYRILSLSWSVTQTTLQWCDYLYNIFRSVVQFHAQMKL